MKARVSHSIISSQAPGRREQGSVLVISLLILLVMSLLSITSVNNSVLEEKMAANSRSSQLAFQAAEAALREGENYVSQSMTANTDINGDIADTVCTNGFCDCDNRIGAAGENGCPLEYWTDGGLNVWNASFKPYSGSLQEGENASFIIEYMGKTQPAPPAAAEPDPRLCATCPDMYRITALGVHINSGARVMLQSTFRID